MLASLALVPAYTIAVLAPTGPDDGCPSPRQVNEALVAHLPRTVAPFGQPLGPSVLRLTVTTEGGATLRVDLTDPGGGPLLHRLLPARDRGPADCTALAETAALIVDRFWHEVGYDVPLPAPPAPARPPPAPAKPPPAPELAKPPPAPEPVKPPPAEVLPAPTVEERVVAPPPEPPVAPEPPLPPPRFWFGAAADGRAESVSTHDFSAAVAFAVERPIRNRRAGLRLSAGATDFVSATWATGHAKLLQFPIRMGAYLPIEVGIGRLEPGLALDLDLIAASVTDSAGEHTDLRASPGADAALGWALRFSDGAFVRVLAKAGAAVPYRFVTTMNDTPIWHTPRAYLALGLEFGLWFP